MARSFTSTHITFLLACVVLLQFVFVVNANNNVAYFCVAGYDEEKARQSGTPVYSQQYMTVESGQLILKNMDMNARNWECTTDNLWTAPLERGATGCWRHVQSGMHLAFTNELKPTLTTQCNSTLNMFRWSTTLRSALHLGTELEYRYLAMDSTIKAYISTQVVGNSNFYRWNLTTTKPAGSYPTGQSQVTPQNNQFGFCINFQGYLYTQYRRGSAALSVPYLAKATTSTRCSSEYLWRVEQVGGAFVPQVYVKSLYTHKYLWNGASGLGTSSSKSAWLLTRHGSGYQLQSMYDGKYLSFRNSAGVYAASLVASGGSTFSDLRVNAYVPGVPPPPPPSSPSPNIGGGKLEKPDTSSMMIVPIIFGCVVGAAIIGLIAFQVNRYRNARESQRINQEQCPHVYGNMGGPVLLPTDQQQHQQPFLDSNGAQQMRTIGSVRPSGFQSGAPTQPSYPGAPPIQQQQAQYAAPPQQGLY